MGRKLVRHYDVSPLQKPIPQITIASDKLVGQWGQDLNILDNAGLFAMVADSNIRIT
jgi:hypothetical protein